MRPARSIPRSIAPWYLSPGRVSAPEAAERSTMASAKTRVRRYAHAKSGVSRRIRNFARNAPAISYLSTAVRPIYRRNPPRGHLEAS